MFLHSFTIISTYFYCVEEPFLGVIYVATIFPLIFNGIRKKTNFLVWEMILLYCLVEIKEMVVGGATFNILYNVLPKEIITERGLELI